MDRRQSDRGTDRFAAWSRHAGVRAPAVAVVVSLVVLPAVAPPAAGAGGTTVSLVPGDGAVGVGETVTVQVVVDDADGGVGAAEFRVAVDDPDTARVVDATVRGSGRVQKRVAGDGSWIDVEYAFVDTADTGGVVVAAVTVEGVGDGTAALSLEPAAGNDAMDVYDEAGTGYSVTGTDGARLSVRGTEGGGGVSEPEPTADAASAATDGGNPDAGDDTADPGATPPADTGDAASTDAPSGSGPRDDADGSAGSGGDASSSEATDPASEQSSGADGSTALGTTSADTLDRVAGAVGGRVGVAVAAVVLLVGVGIGIGRRI